MSVEVRKNGLLPLEISAIKLEKVPESALILEKGLLESTREGNTVNFVNGCAKQPLRK